MMPFQFRIVIKAGTGYKISWIWALGEGKGGS